ncbi:hypothetical protein [Leptospira weilii]|uniref:hypothetical protein n=1 Tax=Leptospira weilii TaxID=28184 RepID=UPI001E540BFF|nr:hypothetical protein [Leptospira weilii]
MLKLTVFYFIGAYKPPGNVRQYDIFTEKLETYDFFELKKGNTESTKFKNKNTTAFNYWLQRTMEIPNRIGYKKDQNSLSNSGPAFETRTISKKKAYRNPES